MVRALAALLCALLGLSAAQAQYVPGYAPGFRSGFQFTGAASFPTPGAVVDYDFKNARFSGPAISVSNASGGYVDDAAGNWTLVPPNTLRRSNKGVLIEGAQTNSIRNNSMQGAGAGTPPTNWSGALAGNGITQTFTGPTTDSGVDCLDIALAGTLTGAGQVIYFDNSFIAAAPGQLWSASAFHRVTTGSISALSLSVTLREYDSSQVFLRQTTVALGSTGAMQRAVNSVTIGASTAFIQVGLRVGGTSGSVNGTLRIGWPQLEQWSTAVTTVGGASSPIRTTGTAATRAADVVAASLGSGISSGTIAAVFQPAILTLSGAIARLGTSSDRISFRENSSDATRLQVIPVNGGVGSSSPLSTASGSLTANTRYAAATAFAPNDLALSLQGSTPTASAPATMPAGMVGVVVGSDVAPLNGYIERLAIYPNRAANSNLQTLSTLQNWGG
jgi:hypothetical protein